MSTNKFTTYQEWLTKLNVGDYVRFGYSAAEVVAINDSMIQAMIIDDNFIFEFSKNGHFLGDVDLNRLIPGNHDVLPLHKYEFGVLCQIEEYLVPCRGDSFPMPDFHEMQVQLNQMGIDFSLAALLTPTVSCLVNENPHYLIRLDQGVGNHKRGVDFYFDIKGKSLGHAVWGS